MLMSISTDAPDGLEELRDRLLGMRDACDEMQKRIDRLISSEETYANDLLDGIISVKDHWNAIDIRSHCENTPSFTSPIDSEEVIDEAYQTLESIAEDLEDQIDEYTAEQEELEEDEDEEVDEYEIIPDLPIKQRPTDIIERTVQRLESMLNGQGRTCKCEVCNRTFAELPELKAELTERQARARLGL